MNTPSLGPVPVRLRPVTSGSIGTTAFFRNRPLLSVLIRRMAKIESSRISVLVHACSIGAEVWSLAIAADLDSRLADKDVLLTACDIEAQFVAHAQRAIYPRMVLEGMRAEEQTYFESFDAEHVRVCDRLRDRVRFLPPQSIAEFDAPDEFDVVLLLNALLYVPADVQSRTIDLIARYNRSIFVTTGFHSDRIKADMERGGYQALSEDARAIHDGWTDRRRDGPIKNELIPGKIYHHWSLPAFSNIEEFEYKYCSIFEKRAI